MSNISPDEARAIIDRLRPEGHANTLVYLEAHRLLTDGPRTEYSDRVDQAEKLRKEGEVEKADALHRQTFGDTVSHSLAKALKLVKEQMATEKIKPAGEGMRAKNLHNN